MAFPLELDMSPYCDNVDKGEPLLYELFSVVVHSGSTHSGHYTAYIRDTRDLGNWTHPVSPTFVVFKYQLDLIEMKITTN